MQKNEAPDITMSEASPHFTNVFLSCRDKFRAGRRPNFRIATETAAVVSER